MATLLSRNVPAAAVTLGSLAFLGLSLALPPLRRLFHFEAVPPLPLLGALGAGVGSVVWFEAVKAVRLARARR